MKDIIYLLSGLLPVLVTLAIVWGIAEIRFKRKLAALDEEFYREARRIDELEKRLTSGD